MVVVVPGVEMVVLESVEERALVMKGSVYLIGEGAEMIWRIGGKEESGEEEGIAESFKD